MQLHATSTGTAQQKEHQDITRYSTNTRHVSHALPPTCTSICSLLALMLLLIRYGRPDSKSGSLLLSLLLLLPLLPPPVLLLLLLVLCRKTPAFSAMKPSTLSALSIPVTKEATPSHLLNSEGQQAR
jgi:hypothetical protein